MLHSSHRESSKHFLTIISYQSFFRGKSQAHVVIRASFTLGWSTKMYEKPVQIRSFRSRKDVEREIDFPWTDSKRFPFASCFLKFSKWWSIFQAKSRAYDLSLVVFVVQLYANEARPYYAGRGEMVLSSLAPHKLPGVEQGLMGRFRRCGIASGKYARALYWADTTCRAVWRILVFLVRLGEAGNRWNEKNRVNCKPMVSNNSRFSIDLMVKWREIGNEREKNWREKGSVVNCKRFQCCRIIRGLIWWWSNRCKMGTRAKEKEFVIR